MISNKSSLPLDKNQKIPLQKRLQQKKKIIEILQQKNDTLFKEVQRITKIIEELNQKSGKKENKNKQALVQATNDPEVLNRQLKNCYKKIKLYQYEVDRLKQKHSIKNTTQKLMGLQTQIKQKKLIENKLKQQLNAIVKQIAENSKKLAGDNHQVELQKQFKSKTDQFRFLKEMIREYESKDQIKQRNLKTEYDHIKKIEKEFIDEGGDRQQLENIKKKALSTIKQVGLKKNSNKEATLEQNQETKTNKQNLNSIPLQKNVSFVQSPSNQQSQEQQIEDRTITHYESLSNELSVLQKLNIKYEKQLEQSQNQINEILQKSDQSRKRLQQLQREIQLMNTSIKVKKSFIIPQNMKPTHRKTSRSVNVPEKNTINISELRQNNKRKRNIINLTAISGEREQRLYHM